MKNIFNSIPFIPFQNAIGKKIVKIGICPDKNTCRILLDDGSLLWIQSVGGEQYILRHALDAAIIEPSEEARQLSESSHVEWFSFPNAKSRSAACDEQEPEGFSEQSGASSASPDSSGCVNYSTIWDVPYKGPLKLNQNQTYLIISPDGSLVRLTPDNCKEILGYSVEIQFYPGEEELPEHAHHLWDVAKTN